MALTEWFEENVSKGFIRQSVSPFAAHLFFVNKLDGGLEFCVDYWDNKSNKIRNRYPLPGIKETLKCIREHQDICESACAGGLYWMSSNRRGLA